MPNAHPWGPIVPQAPAWRLDSHTAPHFRSAWVLAAVTVLAAALRLPQIDESLWLDELHTGWCVEGDWSDVAPRARLGNHVPGYFWLMKAWTELSGASTRTLRIPSLVAGIVLVPLLMVLLWQWTRSPLAACAGGLLIATDRHAIFFAQEARPYALVQVICLMQWEAFRRAVRTGRFRPRVLHGLLAATAFHLHVTSALLLLAEAVVLVGLTIRLGGMSRRRMLRIAGDAAFVLMLMSPALPYLLELVERRGIWSGMFGAANIRSLAITVALPYLGVPLVAVAVDRWIEIKRGRGVPVPHRASPRASRWLLVWWLVPVGAATLLTLFDVAHLLVLRYLVAAFPGLVAWSATLAARSHRSGVPWAVLALLSVQLAAGGTIGQFVRDGRVIGDRTEGWRDAMRWMAAREPNTVPLLVGANLLEQRHGEQTRGLDADYAMFPIRSIYRLSWEGPVRPLRVRPQVDWTREHATLLNTHGSVWLLMRMAPRDWEAARRELLEHTGPGARLVEARSFGRVHVARLVVPSTSGDGG